MKRPIILLLSFLLCAAAPATQPAMPVHKNITATVFWVGEDAGKDNANIANVSSAWDEAWTEHFGGVDDPTARDGFLPKGFKPRENPFYFALPYNDIGDAAREKTIPWAAGEKVKPTESHCKNRWIKITRGAKTCYAQWEDVGPFQEKDAAYVFGDSAAVPKNKRNQNAGLDLSPAAAAFLNVDGMKKVDWQFVDAADVPDGPWKTTITSSGTHWK